jgi:hypothetical protein
MSYLYPAVLSSWTTEILLVIRRTRIVNQVAETTPVGGRGRLPSERPLSVGQAETICTRLSLSPNAHKVSNNGGRKGFIFLSSRTSISGLNDATGVAINESLCYFITKESWQHSSES